MVGKEAATAKPEVPPFSLGRIFKFALPWDKWLIAVGCATQLLSGAVMPVFMLVFGDLLGDLGADGKEYAFYVSLMGILGVVAFALGFVGTWTLELSAERQVKALKEAFLSGAMRQEMAFFDAEDGGTLATRMNENAVLVRNAIGAKLGQSCMFLAMFVGGYVVGMIRGWKMTLVLTAVMPLLAFCGAFMMWALASGASMEVRAYAKSGAVAEEALDSVRTVVAFSTEEQAISRYKVPLLEAMKSSSKAATMFGVGFGIMMGILFLSYSLGFWYGGKLVADDLRANCTEDCFDGGDALTVFFAVIIAAFSIGQAAPPVQAIIKASAAMHSLLEIANRKPQIDPFDPNGEIPSKLEGEVVFQNAAFKYPTREKPVFANLDLRIPAGKTVALVGASGCGKSTIVQLVERFYDLDSGDVTVDGRDMREYNLKWLREQMALVSQEPRLFSRSILKNICHGKPDATKEEAIQAAKLANAHDFVMDFPEGYDTFVGEGGSQLSGGQKQRIAIARAIIRDPAILILDEATSALDNESEKIVQQTLDDLLAARTRTTIVIAHRLSTVRNADKIIVMDDEAGLGGVVLEEGNHHELMQIENGIYRYLVESQTLQGTMGSARMSIDDIAISALTSEVGSVQERHRMSIARKFSHTPSFYLRKEAEKMETKALSLTQEESAPEMYCGCIPKKKHEKEEEDAAPAVSFWRVLGLLKPVWIKIAIGILGAIGNGLVFPIFAVILAEFIGVYYLDDPEKIEEESAFWALMFIALAGGVFAACSVQTGFSEWAGARVTRDLREAVFSNIVYQEIGFFDDPKNSTGNLSEILSSDCLLVKGWVGSNLGLIIQNVTALIAGVIIAFTASAELAAVTLAAFAVMVPASFMQMKFMAGETVVVEDGADTAGFVMHEAITGIRTVAAFGLQESMSADQQAVLQREVADGKKRAFYFGFFWGLSQFVMFGAQAMAFWYGGKMMEDGKIDDVQTLMRATFALMMAAMGIGQTAPFMTDSTKAAKGAAKAYAIIDRKPLIDARDTGGKQLDTVTGNISLKDVNFRYPMRPDVPVFRDLSFSVGAGETVALVGASGCGKSTIVQLLERFYEAASGFVTVDGESVQSINVKSLRSKMGLVSQEPRLFHTTIAENIRYGKSSATMEEVMEAAKMSNAHDFIMSFPDGYDTDCGPYGGQLSGGQKQRVAIARALIRSPPILLLDEATSALDAESERIVQEALDGVLAQGQRTTIVIAHRLSTIQNADKIIVLTNDNKEGATVAEVGSHAELLKLKGIYYGLVQVTEKK